MHRAHTHRLVFKEMSAFSENSKKPKDPSLSSNAPVLNTEEPATSTSTKITTTSDPRPLVSTDSAIVSAQVIQAADVTVSVQLGLSY